MADDRTPEKRSENMARIRSRDTGPELKLRKCLWSKGLRYRLNSSLKGKPDLIFAGKRLAVFVDGCFWHGCPEHGTMPKSNSDYWRPKIKRNMARDRDVTRKLSDAGWKVVRIWEHEILGNIESAASKIINALNRHD